MRIDQIPKYKLPEIKFPAVEYFTDMNLMEESRQEGATLVFDVESYWNYFLVAFQSTLTGRVVTFESDTEGMVHGSKLKWIMDHFRVVGFNSLRYDVPMVYGAISGLWPDALHNLSNALIQGMRTYEVESSFGFNVGTPNHIDIKEVAPGVMISLKEYGVRLNCPIVQDLPYHHDEPLTWEQKQHTYWYCINDLWETMSLFNELRTSIKLREEIGIEYHLDLRSKSDAQISEAVIINEVRYRTGMEVKKPDNIVGKQFIYEPPAWMQFFSQPMQDVFNVVKDTPFIVNDAGYINLPDRIKNMNLRYGRTDYQLGIGGLHSKEKNQTVEIDEDHILIDRDVASYYPAIILNLGLAPAHIGSDFLDVFRDLVDRRLKAKREGDKKTADSLKITINGCFGKLGSKWSKIYSPRLMLQTTVTGQLALLQLIEMVEFMGGVVMSANTDGIVIKVQKCKQDQVNQAIMDWERITGFVTEEDRYRGLYSRDVNNYLAIKTDGEFKTKGVFNCPLTMKNLSRERLMSTPKAYIVSEAAVRFLATYQQSKPETIEGTVKKCKDLTMFIRSQKVNNGGASKDKQYLGKVIRWYYSKKEWGSISRVDNGNRVPDSDGALPIQQLPDKFPTDIDYSYYIRAAYALVNATGVFENAEQKMLFPV